PRLAAVCGLEDAAIAAGAPQAAGGRDEHDVVVARIDDDAVDVARRAQAHVDVGLAAVGRLVDAVAPAGALPVVRLAGADPDEIGIALRDGDVANRHQADVLELRLERRAAVRGLPHAAVRGADVVDRRVRFIDGEVGDAAGHRGRAYRTEMQRLERTAAASGRGRRLAGASEERRTADRGKQRDE